jgi:hypothetical protein
LRDYTGGGVEGQAFGFGEVFAEFNTEGTEGTEADTERRSLSGREGRGAASL